MRNKGTCIHFLGFAHQKTCDAGVNMREVTGGPDLGWIARAPCHRWPESTNRATCELYTEPTDEQVAEAQAEIEALIRKSNEMDVSLAPTISRIKRENKGRSNSGKEPCPACKSGILYWAIAAYNGHVRMQCTAEGCVNFIE